MLTFIFFAFVAYLLFKLIVDFVIPIYKTTQRVKKGFREMHQKMNGHSSPPQQPDSGLLDGVDQQWGQLLLRFCPGTADLHRRGRDLRAEELRRDRLFDDGW